MQGVPRRQARPGGLCGRPLDSFAAVASFYDWESVSQGFASAEATKGLSDRPLETFGPYAADGNLHKNGLCQVINLQ